MTTADEVKRDDQFTKDEIRIIFGACVGFDVDEIAKRYKMTEEDVWKGMKSIMEKAGLMSPYCAEFVADAVNNELHRRRASTQPR